MLNGHGDDAYHYNRSIVCNFSSNVYNQNGLSGLKSFLREQLDDITSYPHPEAASLQEKIAAGHTISPENVCVANGSVESIYLIAQVFRNKRSAILIPTFSEYADACHIHRHQVAFIHTLDDLNPFDVVWVCNPNNPTGKVYDKTYLTEIICRHPDVLFVIDQAYESFTAKPVLLPKEIIAFPNVISLHSMTKRFAIPGLRLGYVAAQAKLIHRLRAQRMPWSVNCLAIAAGHYLLDQDWPLDITAYLKEKDRLSEALQAINDLEVLPSDTHFMLMRLHRGKGADLKDYLVHAHGILIRDASNFQGLDHSYIRIATQTSSDNDQLIHAIQSWFTTF